MATLIDAQHFLNLWLSLQREVLGRTAPENEDCRLPASARAGSLSRHVALRAHLSRSFKPSAAAARTNDAAVTPIGTGITNQPAFCCQDNSRRFVHVQRRVEGELVSLERFGRD